MEETKKDFVPFNEGGGVERVVTIKNEITFFSRKILKLSKNKFLFVS